MSHEGEASRRIGPKIVNGLRHAAFFSHVEHREGAKPHQQVFELVKDGEVRASVTVTRGENIRVKRRVFGRSLRVVSEHGTHATAAEIATSSPQSKVVVQKGISVEISRAEQQGSRVFVHDMKKGIAAQGGTVGFDTAKEIIVNESGTAKGKKVETITVKAKGFADIDEVGKATLDSASSRETQAHLKVLRHVDTVVMGQYVRFIGGKVRTGAYFKGDYIYFRAHGPVVAHEWTGSSYKKVAVPTEAGRPAAKTRLKGIDASTTIGQGTATLFQQS